MVHSSVIGMKIRLLGSPRNMYLLNVHISITCRVCSETKSIETNRILPEEGILLLT